jgi:uncharacterized membrane protein
VATTTIFLFFIATSIILNVVALLGLWRGWNCAPELLICASIITAFIAVVIALTDRHIIQGYPVVAGFLAGLSWVTNVIAIDRLVAGQQPERAAAMIYLALSCLLQANSFLLVYLNQVPSVT